MVMEQIQLHAALVGTFQDHHTDGEHGMHNQPKMAETRPYFLNFHRMATSNFKDWHLNQQNPLTAN